jgi:hypothetical protein
MFLRLRARIFCLFYLVRWNCCILQPVKIKNGMVMNGRMVVVLLLGYSHNT